MAIHLWMVRRAAIHPADDFAATACFDQGWQKRPRAREETHTVPPQVEQPDWLACSAARTRLFVDAKINVLPSCAHPNEVTNCSRISAKPYVLRSSDHLVCA